MTTEAERLDFADGKYTVINDNGKLTALRHGEPWGRDLIGDNLVYWMFVKAREQAAEIERLKAEVQAKSDVLAGSLKAQGQKDALLRQALEAMEDVKSWTLRLPKYLEEEVKEAIAAVKTHLGGQT